MIDVEAMDQTATVDVAVIGAGIVGCCIAYELRKQGLDVLLIDKDGPGQGCSFGNSGAISPGSVAPLAMPGVLASVPGMLIRRDSPLVLPWQYLPQAATWLMRFVWSSRPSAVRQSAAQLARIHEGAVGLHESLAREVGVPELILRRGHLQLYRDERALAKDRASWRLRTQYGIAFNQLDRKAMLKLEPTLPEHYQTGVFLEEQATVTNPFRYVQAIFQAYVNRGGKQARAQINQIKPIENALWQLRSAGATVQARHVVVSAGAWSRQLLKPLGIKLRLLSQRGYHIQFKGGQSPVSRTVVLTDQRVFVTPMEDGLRVGGTVELGGLDAPANLHRADLLVRIAQDAFPTLKGQEYTRWMGHRPCMPDSIPVVGPAAGLPGLWLATGHGHLGLTDSIRTAIHIAQEMGATNP